MSQIFNLPKAFIKWYTGEAYPDLGSTRKLHFELFGRDTETNRDYWMQEAFKAGAQAMANETRCILSDYSAACAGLEPEFMELEEIYERAENSLTAYYEQVFTK